MFFDAGFFPRYVHPMSSLNTIIEYEGPIVNVRPRWWAAHQAAITAVGFRGPSEDEFWRLVRTKAPEARMVPHGKPQQVAEYTRLRDEHINSTDLMKLDELQPDVADNLPVLKQMGACHLVTLCRNREGINSTLDRLDIWMHFDRKEVLPEDRDRRVQKVRDLMGRYRSTLAVVTSPSMAYVANEAGCPVVGLKTGLSFPQQLRQRGVDLIYESLDELVNALSRRDPELQRIGLS